MQPEIMQMAMVQTNRNSLYLSVRFNGHFLGEPGLAIFIGAKDDGNDGDSWSCMTCKAPVKSSPPTNQHPTFYRSDALLSSNQQCQSTEGKNITFHGLAHPELTWKSSNFVCLTTKCSW